VDLKMLVLLEQVSVRDAETGERELLCGKAVTGYVGCSHNPSVQPYIGLVALY
jgi:hypothetical protein